MRFIPIILSAALFCLAGFPAEAAHTRASLLVAADSARLGDTVLAGVRLRMEPGWHTYWKNAGASGMPTKIEWQLPPGVTAGEIQWPVPEKLPDEDLTTYIYKDEVVLLVPLKLAANLRPGPLDLKAKVSWLECEVMCIPGSDSVQAKLNVGDQTKSSPDAALLAAWQKRLPQKSDTLTAHAWWEKSATNNLRPLVLEWNSAAAASAADFYPDASEQFEVQGPTERIPADTGKIRLQKQVKKLEGQWPEQVSGVLVQTSGKERLAYEIKCPVAASGPAAAAGLSASGHSLWQMLIYAFLFGLILNVMPCVLPVIALKIFGFVGQAREHPRQVRKLGLIYTLGVLVSFLILASIVIGLKAAGNKVGWGFQFTNPYFLISMTVLVTLVALNLFGVFEVTLGGRTLAAAASLSSKQGSTGAFFNGLLATLLATSCSVPIVGTAVGFAFAEGPTIILLIMLTVGLGLATPYVILSWQPAWLSLLPKPGPWMERFKVAMGFPMLAATIWLLNLVSTYYGDRTWWLAVFLVLLALSLWVYGQFVQRGTRRRGLAWAVAALLLIFGYSYAIEGNLRWREPLMSTTAPAQVPAASSGIAWQPWSSQAVSQARAEGRPVLVDFTAKWCPTCQGNKIILESTDVRAKLKSTHAVTLLADYTRQPDDMTTELNRFGRAAVPMVLIYPRNQDQPPMVFDIVTPGAVLNALDRAAR